MQYGTGLYKSWAGPGNEVIMAARKRASATTTSDEAQADGVGLKGDKEELKEKEKIVNKLSERERTRRIWIIYFIGFMVST